MGMLYEEVVKSRAAKGFEHGRWLFGLGGIAVLVHGVVGGR